MAIAAEYRELASRYRESSYIIDPRGEVIAGPAEGETILVAEGSTKEILAAKSVFDSAGHYSRPDIFQLRLNRIPCERVGKTSGKGPGTTCFEDDPAGRVS